MADKQAVVETTAGTFVIQLLPDVAPNHVAHFMKTARDGGYTGTIFHHVIRYGIIQGGDPLSKDPAKVAPYGTGGLNELKPEINAEKLHGGRRRRRPRAGQARQRGRAVLRLRDRPARARRSVHDLRPRR